MWSGLAFNDDRICNRARDNSNIMGIDIAVGSLFALITWGYLAFHESVPWDNTNPEDPNYMAAKQLDIEKDDEQIAKLEYHTWKYVIFFFVMVFLSFYLLSICTNWGRVQLFGETFDYAGYGHSNSVLWIKVLNALFTSIMV